MEKMKAKEMKDGVMLSHGGRGRRRGRSRRKKKAAGKRRKFRSLLSVKPEEIRGGCCYVLMAPFQCENQQPDFNITVLRGGI